MFEVHEIIFREFEMLKMLGIMFGMLEIMFEMFYIIFELFEMSICLKCMT